MFITDLLGFPGSSAVKDSTCNAGDPSYNFGLGRFPEEGNGYPLQYSCLENSMDRGAWQATVHEVAKSQTMVGNTYPVKQGIPEIIYTKMVL